MGADWDEPRDKAPPIEETDRRWKFRKKGKKKFIIERRYVGPTRNWHTKIWDGYREWHTDRKYETKRARTEAFSVLTRRDQKYTHWEYRISVL